MKKLIANFLNLFGYDIVKVAPTPFFKKNCIVKVGNYDLIMPHFNPLIKTYKLQKDFASEIGRLTTYIHSKYPNLIFLDVGANTGDTVARVKSVLDIPIISIEGDDTSFDYLSKNVKQFSQVTIIKQFLGERDERIKANLEKSGWNTTLVPIDTSRSEIEIKSLDTILHAISIQIENMKILKIDTEGFDTIILRGAKKFLTITKPIVFLEYNSDNMRAINEDGLATVLSLKNLGYNKILFYDDIGRFMFSTTISNEGLIKNMHNYISLKGGLVYYYNICLFHSVDDDLALKTEEGEAAYILTKIK